MSAPDSRSISRLKWSPFLPSSDLLHVQKPFNYMQPLLFLDVLHALEKEE